MEYECDPLEYECDPLDLQVMSDETNGEADIERRDFSDKSTNQGNDDNPTIDQVINEATKLTSKETVESSGLEILKSVQPAEKRVSSNQSNSFLEYEYDPLEFECDPLNLQVMSDETNGEAEIEGRDLSDKSTNQGNDDNPMIDQVINEATKVTSKDSVESLDLDILESVQPPGKSVSSNQSKNY